MCGPWAPSTPGDTRFPVLARALQRLLSSSDVHEAMACIRQEVPCGVRTAAGIIRAAVRATPAAASVSYEAAPSRPPLRQVRRARLGSQGAGPRLHVWARGTGEARFIFNVIAVEHCYGDPVTLALGVVVDEEMNLGIFNLYVARTRRGSGGLDVLGYVPAAEAYALAVRSLREHEGQVVEVGDRPMSGDMAPPAPRVVGRSHGQVGERCVLQRRRRRQRPRAPVAVGPLWLPRQRPRLALTRVACGTVRGKDTRPGPASVARDPLQSKSGRSTRQAGGRQGGASCGRWRRNQASDSIQGTVRPAAQIIRILAEQDTLVPLKPTNLRERA